MLLKQTYGKKWLRMAELYKRFAWSCETTDWSEDAKMAMYRHESLGEPLPETNKINGYVLGKKAMDITVAMWKEDIEQYLLSVKELQEEYPEWFLKQLGILEMKPVVSKCRWWYRLQKN